MAIPATAQQQRVLWRSMRSESRWSPATKNAPVESKIIQYRDIEKSTWRRMVSILFTFLINFYTAKFSSTNPFIHQSINQCDTGARHWKSTNSFLVLLCIKKTFFQEITANVESESHFSTKALHEGFSGVRMEWFAVAPSVSPLWRVAAPLKPQAKTIIFVTHPLQFPKFQSFQKTDARRTEK